MIKEKDTEPQVYKRIQTGGKMFSRMNTLKKSFGLERSITGLNQGGSMSNLKKMIKVVSMQQLRQTK